jgi:broad specificity phosphatase PhoE
MILFHVNRKEFLGLMPTTIYLIRHGETDWNRNSVFRGRTDVPLNKNGLLQVAAVGRGLEDVEFDAVCSSPLCRALQTADAIVKDRNLEAIVIDEFTDIDYGKWQGLSLNHVKTKYPKEYKKWLNEPHKALIPDGERLSDIYERTWNALTEVVANYPDQNVAIAAHRVVNKVLVLAAIGLPLKDFWRIRQDNCSINILEFSGKDVIIHLINDTCHLKNISLLTADF